MVEGADGGGLKEAFGLRGFDDTAAGGTDVGAENVGDGVDKFD